MLGGKSLWLNTLHNSRQSIHNTQLKRCHKSLLLNALRDSSQSILSKIVTRKVLRTKYLPKHKPVASLLFFKDPAAATVHHLPSEDGHSRRRRLTLAFPFYLADMSGAEKKAHSAERR
jgi:hypothetical protein